MKRMCVMLVCWGVLVCGGCSPAEVRRAELPVSVDRDRPPADLSMGITIFFAADDPADTRGVRRARFLIEPDGQLRAATGPAVGLDLYPPRTRRLTDAQVLDVYSRIVRGGMNAPVGASESTLSAALSIAQSTVQSSAGASMRAAGPERSVVVVDMIAHQRQTVSVRVIDESPAAADLADRLFSLARVRAASAR